MQYVFAFQRKFVIVNITWVFPLHHRLALNLNQNGYFKPYQRSDTDGEAIRKPRQQFRFRRSANLLPRKTTEARHTVLPRHKSDDDDDENRNSCRDQALTSIWRVVVFLHLGRTSGPEHSFKVWPVSCDVSSRKLCRSNQRRHENDTYVSAK